MNQKTRFMIGTALAAQSLALAGTAAAQTSPDIEEPNQPVLAEQVESDPDNTIIVTGSYIRGQREDGAQPVDVFGQEELATRGIDSPLLLFSLLMALFIVYTHRSNISRMRDGTESRIARALLSRRH